MKNAVSVEAAVLRRNITLTGYSKGWLTSTEFRQLPASEWIVAKLHIVSDHHSRSRSPSERGFISSPSFKFQHVTQLTSSD
jgi:hypothetical protein